MLFCIKISFALAIIERNCIFEISIWVNDPNIRLIEQERI